MSFDPAVMPERTSGRRGPQRQFEDERRSALATHRSGDTSGVYALQALSVESAFGACDPPR
jgi:hypothetical protein